MNMFDLHSCKFQAIDQSLVKIIQRLFKGRKCRNRALSLTNMVGTTCNDMKYIYCIKCKEINLDDILEKYRTPNLTFMHPTISCTYS